jgi:O-antigen ligase
VSATSWRRSGGWDTVPDLPDEVSHERRQRGTADFVLFTIIPMAGIQISGVPLMEIASALAVLLAMTRAPRVRPALGITALLVVAMVGMMFLSADLNDLTPYRRLLHLVLFATVMVVVSQGRFHVGGLSRGLALGLVISGAAYLGGSSSGYEGRLTGLFADPNAAGYILTTLGCLALGGLTTSRLRWPVGLVVLVFIVLTFSRTSLLATALILVWMLIGSRVATLFGSVLLGMMLYVVINVPISLRNFGPFEDRTGSDALRVRIVAQERVQIQDGPWYGNGPGTSRVDVQGETFFFHNSYLALQNEAGLLGVALLVGAGIVALLGLMRLPAGSRNFWYEGALIALAVCAVNLGEVLLELPAALVLGMALYHARVARQGGSDPPPITVPGSSANRVNL